MLTTVLRFFRILTVSDFYNTIEVSEIRLGSPGDGVRTMTRAKTQSAPSKRAKKRKRFFAFLASWRESIRRWHANGGAKCSQANARYFIRSLILARAARAHSSSNWPPGAPLTPIAPIAFPPAMMVTPPVA